MIMFSKIRIGLLSAAFLMTTAINAPALANSSLTLPELSPRQIAQDVRIITHPQTGQLDYILPSFDPFENDPTLAGTAQLRSANNTVTIDGHSVRGGAILDLTFYYNTNTSDPYDTRGYGDAAFLSGDYADVTLQDSRILECSQDIQDVVYYHEDYYAPSFHSNLYRPYRHYSGFNGFGSRAFGGFNSFGIIGGSLLGRSFIGNRGFNARANTIRRDIIRNRRINERRSDLEDRLRDGNERRNRRDAGDRVRDNNRPDGRRTDNRNRDNRDDARPRRRNNDRIRNNERREERRRRLTDEQRRAFTSRNADSTVANNNITSSRRRIVRPNRGSQGVVSARNSLRSNRRADREVRLTNAATARTSPKQSTNKQVSQRKSSPKTTQNRSQSRQQNNSGKQSRTTRNSQSRSKSQSRNKSKNFQSRSNLRGARIIALGPMASLFGRSNVRQVSTQCAREEILSLHIPQHHIDAARYDGLTVVVIDRTGYERPVYIPPNYIEGFRQVSSQINTVRPYETSRTQGYPMPIAPEPYQPSPNHEQAPCPVGTTPQNDGTCLSTPAYSGYPQ